MNYGKKIAYTAYLTFIILCVVITTTFTGTASASAASARAVQIEEITGEVFVHKSGGSKTIKAYPHMQLHEGDRLLTGASASAVLKVMDQQDVLVVSENTQLYIRTLQKEGGNNKSIFTIWSGSLLVKANPLKQNNHSLEVESPTTTMNVKGTLFQIVVDPITGRNTMTVFEGIVAARGTNTEDRRQPDDSRLVYPAQQFSAFPDDTSEDTNSYLTMIDPERLAESLDSSVIEALLRNKAEMDKDNEALIQRLLEQMNDGNTLDVPQNLVNNAEDLKRYEANLQQLLHVILSQAVNVGKIDREQIDKLIDKVNKEINANTDIDLGQTSLDLTEEQQRRLDIVRDKEEQRRQQQQKQQQMKEEIEQRNKELIEKLEQQRRAQEERNKQALEDRKREAEKKYSEMLKGREQQERNQQPTPAPANPSAPSTPSNPSIPSNPSNPGDGDDGDPEGPKDPDEPHNSAPVAKENLNQMLAPHESVILAPADLATDADGDPLNFISTSSENDAIIVAHLDGNQLHLDAISAGTSNITVQVSDGTVVAEIQLIVTVISPGNYIYGTISTPEPAPVGGIPLTISATTSNLELERTLDNTVVIPEGKTSKSYYIKIPDELLEQIFYISYQIAPDFVNDPLYVLQGYVGENNEWGDLQPTDIVIGHNNELVNVHLIQGNVISGNITLAQEALADGEGIRIIAQGPTGFIQQNITIAAGDKSSPYQLIVPPGKDYQVSFDYRDYVENLYIYPQYYYLNINDLMEENPDIDPSLIPEYWLELGQVAVSGPYMASYLDLSTGNQPNIDLNFPSILPEFEVTALNDMIIVTIDPTEKQDYSGHSYFMLDYDYAYNTGIRDAVFTELEADNSYLVRFVGNVANPLMVEGDEAITDMKFHVTTTNEPQIPDVHVLPTTDELDLFWDAYAGATEYRVYVYEQGTPVFNQFTIPVQTIVAEDIASLHTTINTLYEDTNYVVRLEAWNGDARLAGTTLATGTVPELSVEINPSKGSLSWNVCNPFIVYGGCLYQVTAIDGNGKMLTYNTGRYDTEVTLDGLTPGSTYNAWLIAYSSSDPLLTQPRQGKKFMFETGNIPEGPPSAISFVDIDPDAHELGSDYDQFSVTDDVYDNQVTDYVVYWADELNMIIGTDEDGDGKIDPLTTIHNHHFGKYTTLLSNTLIPTGAVKFLVYSRNAYGYSEGYLEFQFEDL